MFDQNLDVCTRIVSEECKRCAMVALEHGILLGIKGCLESEALAGSHGATAILILSEDARSRHPLTHCPRRRRTSIQDQLSPI